MSSRHSSSPERGIRRAYSTWKNRELDVTGTFVTLNIGNTLRGFCGMLGASISLAKAIADSATQTALNNPRMAPVTFIELP